jgi:hypothetical protein
MRKVRVINLHQGQGGRTEYLYATVVDAENGELIIAATLDYILKIAKVRNYQIVK